MDLTALAATAGIDVPAQRWQQLRTNTDATTWRADRFIVKADHTGQAAHILPVLEQLGIPVPELVNHTVYPDGRHLTVTRYIDHDPDHRLTADQWAQAAAALQPLHQAGRDRLTSAGVALERYALSQPARVAVRLERCSQAGGWHAAAARQLGPVATAAAAALDGDVSDEVAIHSDLHAGNLLVDTSGRVTIIDWDLLRQGPAEFDLAPLAVEVATGDRPQAHLDVALTARPDLNPHRIHLLARFKQATAASYHLAESIGDDTAAREAAQRLETLGLHVRR